MESVRSGLSRLPSWLLSVTTFIVILWLTLSPSPLGKEPPALFPGADKLAHAIMFGGYASMLLLDWQRKHQWQQVSLSLGIISALSSSVLGMVIEFWQNYMGLGRSFEAGDILADTIGAFLFMIIYISLQANWTRKN